MAQPAIKRFYSPLTALALAVVCYPLARLPTLPSRDLDALAHRFKFEKLSLPEIPGQPPFKTVRNVHPSLERIAAWVSSLGAAATLTDLDGDGLCNDLIRVDPRTDLVIVAPVPGTGERYAPFTLNSPFWAGQSYDVGALAPMGTLAGDFNEDGQNDLLIYFWGRSPVVYLRGSKSAVTNSPGLSLASFTAQELVGTGERWYSNCATQADLDGDGHIDLVVGNYFQDGAKVLDVADATGTVVMHEGKSNAANGGKDRVFLWHSAVAGGNPEVQYTEIADALPDEIALQWALAIGAADLDGDLLPELYIANDFGPDHLLHNRSTPGELKFAVLTGKRDLRTPKSCVLGQDSFKGMGVDFGDINGDGFLDIYVSNITTEFGLIESHFLWLSTGHVAAMQNGVAPYVHAAEKLGLSRSGFSWDARLADFDNDGSLEAVQACGFIKGKINRWPELQALGTSNDQIVHNPRFWPSFRPGADLSGADSNPFFVRGPDGRYQNVADRLGLSEPMITRGIAIADVDGNGRLDFVTANQWGPSYCFRNDAPNAGGFLGLRVLRASGSAAIGAVARVTLPGGRKLMSQVDGGTGHSGRRSSELHFGLGDAKTGEALPVTIMWREGGQIREKTVTLVPGRHTVQL